MARDFLDPLVDALAKAKLPRIPALPLPERPIAAPFGAITLPKFPSLPTSLDIDERRRGVIKHTIGADAASILGLIPYAGQFLAEQIGDLHMAEVVNALSKEEMKRYMEWEKRLPTNTLPMLASFALTRGVGR